MVVINWGAQAPQTWPGLFSLIPVSLSTLFSLPAPRFRRELHVLIYLFIFALMELLPDFYPVTHEKSVKQGLLKSNVTIDAHPGPPFV